MPFSVVLAHESNKTRIETLIGRYINGGILIVLAHESNKTRIETGKLKKIKKNAWLVLAHESNKTRIETNMRMSNCIFEKPS